MSLDLPTPLLGGLSPAAFMRSHWQRKPMVVRGAVEAPERLLTRQRLLALAARDDVESRLVARDGVAARGRTGSGEGWSLRPGPFARRALPPLSTPGWTLLVQGVDLHEAAIHDLLSRFRFVGDARLDDAMVSFASDGGGVGPHVDSYDVFLLQLAGTRIWRVGKAGARPRLRDDVPLKMLAGFAPRFEWRLDAGDMLYLPPGWGHDGVAVGACLTCSIGFRAPTATSLAADLLPRIAEMAEAADAEPSRRYGDAGRAATATPARIPTALSAFADRAVAAMLAGRRDRAVALGEALSEPKPGTWFDAGARPGRGAGVVLDRRSRMLYDAHHVYLNGQAWRAAGADATLLRRLADRRRLDAEERAAASGTARALIDEWCEAGWCRPASAGKGDRT